MLLEAATPSGLSLLINRCRGNDESLGVCVCSGMCVCARVRTQHTLAISGCCECAAIVLLMCYVCVYRYVCVCACVCARACVSCGALQESVYVCLGSYKREKVYTII